MANTQPGVASFDIDAVIAEFSSDPARTSLELPHMTTGQRKYVKRAVEQHPDLKCESFGFGQDRRLHLFKASKQPSIFNSSRSTSPSDAQPSSRFNSPTTSESERDITPLTQGVQVRNTFIHFETEPRDERAVQSMPHGMFKQSLFEEFAVAAEAAPAPPKVADVVSAEAASPKPEESQVLNPGTEVVIEGLVKAPAFNGRRGVVHCFEEESGRYSILLSSTGSSGGKQWAKVKRDNLCLVLQAHAFSRTALAQGSPRWVAPALDIGACQ